MATTFRAGPVRVRVPATSANLGPGFDALGLALELTDEVEAQVTADGLRVDIDGEGVALSRGEDHLVVRAMRAAFDRLAAEPPGLRLRCVNRIPQGRGLGSSAAAIVAGVLLARALVPAGERLLPDAAALDLSTDLEGHPDNVAPALLGGLTVAWLAAGPDGRRAAGAVGLECDPRISPVAIIPPFHASTEQARGLLPGRVPHADAAANAGRAALLVAALTSRPEHLLAATEDRLHQDYRVSAMPETIALVRSLRAAGLPAVVSGAGPTVLVLARSEHEVDAARRQSPAAWRVERLPPRPAGGLAGLSAGAGDGPAE